MAAGRDKKKMLKSFLGAVILSTTVKRCFVFRMQDFFFAFVWNTGCSSASLKLCVCDAASSWSQSPSPDSRVWKTLT